MNIILIIIVILILIIPLVIYSGLGEEDGYFTGADSMAEDAIVESGFEPWVTSIWEPPSPEIETLLFSLQAAIGAIIIGYFVGYWRSEKKT